MKKRIGVIFGGKSVEHEISILSAIQVIKAIDYSKYDCINIYIDKNNNFYVGNDFDNVDTFKKDNFKKREVIFVKHGKNQVYLKAKKGFLSRRFKEPIDCIVSVVHGLGVEDGSLAGFFKMLDVPYTASDILAASVGQDKVIMKQVFKSDKIPILPFTYFTDNEWINHHKECLMKVNRLGFPVIVKPSRLGSSIGIKIANNIEELKEALDVAFKYDNRVVIEKSLVNFREFNCSILGNYEEYLISEIEEVIVNNHFLSFDDKYINDKLSTTRRIIPAEIPELLAQEIKELCLKITKLLLNKGVSRVDFLYCLEKDKLYVNELNTIPGSLSFYLFEGLDIDFKDLINKLIGDAFKDKYLDGLKLSSFSSNVLLMNNMIKGSKFK